MKRLADKVAKLAQRLADENPGANIYVASEYMFEDGECVHAEKAEALIEEDPAPIFDGSCDCDDDCDGLGMCS